MKNNDPYAEKHLNRLKILVYLIPIAGFFPAIWTIYSHQGTRQQQAASRLAVTLAVIWLMGYMLLETGARSAENLQLPMLLMSSVLTTTYFLVNVGLMIRILAGKPLWLPGVSQISDRLP